MIADAPPYIENYRSEATRKHYETALRQFETFSKINLRVAKSKVLKQKLIDYVTHLRKAGKSYSAQNIAISAVQKWCTVRDIDGINFKSIRENFAGDDDRVVDDQPYTKEELRQMLELANPRLKALILLMVSSGVRVGAVPGLRIRDMKKLEDYGNIYQLTVYPDSRKHKYTTFTSPEAAKAIDDYLHTREIKGEEIKPESPLFRKEFVAGNANKAIEPLTIASIFKLVSQVAVNTGIRVLKKKEGKKAVRHATPLLHSFRKICNTSFVQADIPEIKREMLLGHATGLQGRYTRLEEKEQDLAKEYIKAIPHLTISNTKALMMENEELKTRTADLDTLKSAYMDVKLRLEKAEKGYGNYRDVTKHMYSSMADAFRKAGLSDDQVLKMITEMAKDWADRQRAKKD